MCAPLFIKHDHHLSLFVWQHIIVKSFRRPAIKRLGIFVGLLHEHHTVSVPKVNELFLSLFDFVYGLLSLNLTVHDHHLLPVCHSLFSLVILAHVFIMELSCLRHQHIFMFFLFHEGFDGLLRSLQFLHHVSGPFLTSKFFGFVTIWNHALFISVLIFKIRPHLVHAIVKIFQPFLFVLFIFFVIQVGLVMIVRSFLCLFIKLLFAVVVTII